MARKSSRGGIAWILSILLGVLLLTVGGVKSVGVMTGAGAVVLVCGLAFMIVSVTLKGAMD